MATRQLLVVAMPRLSDSMTSGQIAQWLVADGEQVARGQTVVEIETDKATIGYEADSDGWLRILAHEGAEVAVGEPIAEIHPAPEQPAHPVLDAGAGAADGERVPAANGARARPAGDGGVSPLARRTAERIGVDLAYVTGSGPHGRVLKRDVVRAAEAALATGGAATVDAPAPGTQPAAALAPASSRGPSTRVALTHRQRVTAERLTRARAEIPDFHLTTEIDMDAALELRAEIGRLEVPVPSVNDMIVKACALALRAHPRLNSAWSDGSVEIFERVNVGVAVAADEELLVTTVADADRLPLTAIAAETRRLATAAREGTATPADLNASTFTISNLGMYGVHAFEAIINPPNAAILAVGAIRREPRCDDDAAIRVRPLMSVTLACDHRIVYGAAAAAFLADLRQLLAEPLRLLVS